MLNPNEFARAFEKPSLTRRDANAALAAAGLGAVAVPLMAQPALATADLTIFEWSGYELPEFHPDYAAEYGGEPEYAFFADEEEAFQKIRAGFRVDLSHPCTASIRRWRDAGLIEPIDTARIESWDDIIPDLFSAKGMVIDGDHYMMPWDFGYSQIVYNADHVDIENPSFDIMIDPAYVGKVSWNDQVDTAVAVGGVIAGYDNIFDPSEEDMAKLRDVWEKAMTTSRFLWSDGTEIAQAVAAGEVVAAYMWTSDLVALRDQGINLEIIPPVMPWICGLVVHSNAPGSKDQAYDYLNAMLDPAAGATMVEMYGYGHANRNAYALIDPEVLRSYGLDDPVAALGEGIFFDEIPPAKREALIALWDEVKAGF